MWASAMVPGENSSVESESHEKLSESVSFTLVEVVEIVVSHLERRSSAEDS